MRRALALTVLIWAGAAAAQAPVSSGTPAARPEDQARAAAIATAVESALARSPSVTSSTAVTLSPRPDARPQNLRRRSQVAASGMRVIQPAPFPGRASGGLCGFSDVIGERVQPIPGKIRGCGIGDPIRVSAVSGIALSQKAVMDCPTLSALRTWIATGVKPAVGRLGGGVARLDVAAHYSCRTRNNRPGAKISEHGKGRAIDISGVTLANGQKITVLKGWRGEHRKRLKQMHRAACGPFGTVLGPDSDRYHADHFHFDTARYRSGSYCR